MPDISGRLDIALHRDSARPTVTISSSRPVTAARVFAGKPVMEVARRLPMLFSICATAQAQACALACEQALGVEPSASALRLRGLLLRAETVKEHLWRLLLDWPKAMDLEPATDAMAGAMRAYLALRGEQTAGADPFAPGADPGPFDAARAGNQAGVLAALVTAHVFGRDPERWLVDVVDGDALKNWAESAGTGPAHLVLALMRGGLADLGRNHVPTLPTLSTQSLAEPMAGPAADAFVAAPTFAGRPHETTPLARSRGQPLVAALAQESGNGLLPRLAALLVELAAAASELSRPPPVPPRSSSFDDADGIGIGAAEAARGLLVHRVEVENELVQSYRILAPTEWNFHPDGVVAAGLAGLPVDAADLERRARLYVTAVDPCVDYALSIA